MIKQLFILFLFLFVSISWAQKPMKERHKKLHEMMEAELERMQKMMDQAFGDSKDLEGFLEEFHNDFFEDEFFQSEGFGDIFKQYNSLEFDRQRKYSWKETPNEKILEFKFVEDKNSPIEINIDDKSVRIKGKTKSKAKAIENGVVVDKVTMLDFDRRISLPPGIDSENAKIEKIEGGIRVRFPKTGKAKRSSKDLKPVKPSKGDKTI